MCWCAGSYGGYGLRILFLSTWFPYPPDNGSRIRVYYLLKALKQTHRVKLISFAFGTANPLATEELSNLCDSYEVVNIDPHIRSGLAWRLRFFSRNPIANRPIPAMSKLVQEEGARFQPDVVIASTQSTTTYVSQLPNAPLRVLEDHNCSTALSWERHLRQSSSAARLQTWLSYEKVKRFESRTLRRFDLCTMVSKKSGLKGGSSSRYSAETKA